MNTEATPRVLPTEPGWWWDSDRWPLKVEYEGNGRLAFAFAFSGLYPPERYTVDQHRWLRPVLTIEQEDALRRELAELRVTARLQAVRIEEFGAELRALKGSVFCCWCTWSERVPDDGLAAELLQAHAASCPHSAVVRDRNAAIARAEKAEAEAAELRSYIAGDEARGVPRVDCGSNSCLTVEPEQRTGARVNGPCSCGVRPHQIALQRSRARYAELRRLAEEMADGVDAEDSSPGQRAAAEAIRFHLAANGEVGA